MRTPESQKSASIEEQLTEAIYDNPDPNASHEDKKALIRHNCAEIAKDLGFQPAQGQLLAQYYFKLIEKDPEIAGEFWQQLYGLNYYAKDPAKAEQYLTSLRGLTSETGITYLWDLISGIIRGEYEVIQADPTAYDKCYFLYYRPDAEAELRDKKRHESLRRLTNLVNGVVIEKPKVGYRAYDFAMFNEYESNVLKEINKKLLKHIDIMLYARVEIENIFVYLKWLKQELKRIIKESGADKKSQAKFEIFFSSKIFPFIDKLYKYASTMSENAHENRFVRDIMNEPFIIFNGTVDENHNEISPVERLQYQWKQLDTDLTGYFQNPANANDAMFGSAMNDNSLDGTVFLTATPVQAETVPMPKKDDSDAAVLVRAPIISSKTVMGITALEAMSKPEPTPDPCQETKKEISDKLNATVIGMTALTATPDIVADLVSDYRDDDLKADTGVDHIKKSIGNAPTDIDITVNFREGSPEEAKAIAAIEDDVRIILSSIEYLNTLNGVRQLADAFDKKAFKKISTRPIRKAFIAAILLFVAQLRTEKGLVGRKQPLFTYLRGMFSKLAPNENCKLPNTKELDDLNKKMPKLEDFSQLINLLNKLGIYGSFKTAERELETILIEDLEGIGLHINTDQAARLTPFGQAAFKTLKSVSLEKLKTIRDMKQQVVGKFGTRSIHKLFRKKGENAESKAYFEQMGEFLDRLKIKAMDPTFNNIEEVYYPSSQTASQN